MPRIVIVAGRPQGADALRHLRAAGLDVGLAEQVADLRPDDGYLVLAPNPESLIPSGVAALLASLERTGSDAAVATGGAYGVTELSQPVEGTSLLRTPALLRHRWLSAVLLRRSWWLRQDVAWAVPESRRRALVARVLAAADTIDVVPEPAIAEQARRLGFRRQERLRSEDMPVVADRLDELYDVLAALPGQALRDDWSASVLEPAARSLLVALPEADDATRARLTKRVAAIVTELPLPARAGLPAVTRLAYHLVEQGYHDELLELVKADRSGDLARRRAHRDGGSFVADYPFRDDPRLAVPAEVYRLDNEVDLRARVEALHWSEGRLVIEGFAYLGLVDVTAPGDSPVQLALVRHGDERHIALSVERTYRPDVTIDAREAAYCYDWAGFRTSLDVTALRDEDGWRHGLWRLEATVRDGPVQRTRWLSAVAPGGASHPELREHDGVRIVPTSGRGTFAVEVDPVPAMLTSVEVSGGHLLLHGRLRRRPAGGGREAELLLLRRSGQVGLRARATLRGLRRLQFTAALDLAQVRDTAASDLDGEATWSVRVRLPDGRRVIPLRTPAGFSPVRDEGERDVELRPTPHGRAQLAVRRPQPVVDDARWDRDDLVLTGRWPVSKPHDLLLAARRTAREHPLDVAVEAGRFTVRIPVGAMPTLAGDLPLTHGHWLLAVRRVGADPQDDCELLAEHRVLATLPLAHRIGLKTFELRETDGRLEVFAGRDFRLDELGPANQRRLRYEEFPAFLRQPLRDEVLFESYESRAYADNARAIYEELRRRDTGLRCRWVVADGQTALPAELEPVRRFSRDHYEAMARARYVVVPNYRPMESWFDTPKGQVVLQTWHGAPFKRIGLDNPRWDNLTYRDHERMIRKESARWDYLISPNPPSTPILRRAFGYGGPVLETGYPRTDIFYAPDREQRAAAVRHRLRIPADKRVVLYAPTLRDDHTYGGNRFSLEMRLDLDAARDALGGDHVVLVRRHAKVVDQVPSADGVFARDVSLWPDVNELLLATDVLITDYSSLVFDFANTGRAMLFFTYDLADYRDRLRGLYFDADRLPGPHLSTSDEVIAAIRDADRLRAEYSAAYAAFIRDFCPWDDGHAAERVVDAVFGSLT